MSRRLFLLAALIVVGLFIPGCASDGESQLNTLWRQGYGFNNPNPGRIRQGLPPKDF